jgi:hypothetical protein
MVNISYIYALIPQLENRNIFYSFHNPSFYSSTVSSINTLLSAFSKDWYNMNNTGKSNLSLAQSNNNSNDNCDSNTADLIISGIVSNISKVKYTDSPHYTFSDPKWMQAVVEVKSVEKSNNSHNIQQVVVFFPTSTDISWKNSPKLFIGEKAIFILHMDPIYEVNEEEHYNVVCPLDVQPRS